jgi:hypothetical protein
MDLALDDGVALPSVVQEDPEELNRSFHERRA